jgi:hypothetical protein
MAGNFHIATIRDKLAFGLYLVATFISWYGMFLELPSFSLIISHQSLSAWGALLAVILFVITFPMYWIGLYSVSGSLYRVAYWPPQIVIAILYLVLGSSD